MIRISILLSSCLLTAFAQSNQIVITSAANGTVGVASEGLATAMGTNIASQTATAGSPPWPTTLGKVSIQVTDSASVTRPAGLIFVSPNQINFQIPEDTAVGQATVQFNNGGAMTSATVQVQRAAPALFAIDTTGIAAATAIAIVLGGPAGQQFPVPLFQCEGPICMLIPIDPGLDSPKYLSFYGTGIQGWSMRTNVVVNIGDVTVPAQYAGRQSQFPGLDQVNAALPLSLRGAGVVNVSVTADGITSNAVKIAIGNN
jgi:uncharacterized protein (TIGR03437 family)